MKKHFKFLLIFTFIIVSFLSYGILFAAEPISPPNGAVVTKPTVDLVWSKDENAIKYDIWLLKKSKFGFYALVARLIRDASETSVKIKTGMLEDNSEYLWLVRTITKDSFIGILSKSFKFVTSFGIEQSNQISGQITQNNTQSVDLNSISGLISAIKSKFDITIENGTSQWTLANLKIIYDTLSKLPSVFYNCTKYLQRISVASFGQNIGGYVNSMTPSRVYITDLGANYDLSGILVHEMTHSFQFNGNQNIATMWANKFWSTRNAYNGSIQPLSPPPTDYGKTNPYEDMAESVRLYVFNPYSLKYNNTERYEFIKQYVMNNKEFINEGKN